MKRNMSVALLVCSLVMSAHGQGPASPCPVNPLHFDPDGVSVRVENTSDKTIVGMTWFASVADATEHWNWIFQDVPGPLRLREFNWNREIKPGAKKTLSWFYSNLDFRRSSGGAFILSSVLFSDGSRWEENPAQHTCQVVWLNNHRKTLARPEELPPLP